MGYLDLADIWSELISLMRVEYTQLLTMGAENMVLSCNQVVQEDMWKK
jgi:hypothetical protein